MVVDPGGGGNVVTVESMGYVEDDIDKERRGQGAEGSAASGRCERGRRARARD